MTVRPISIKLNNSKSNNNNDLQSQKKLPALNGANARNNANNVAFGGVGDAVVMFMDGIERGGFVASFLAQDCAGMVVPRIWEGLHRNSEETGQLNWDFAKRETLRECLSGPSTFVIPLALFTAVKKYSGTANNVKVDMIKTFGEEFAGYASSKGANLTDKARTQNEYFQRIYKNVLKTSTNGQMPEEELNKTAKEFADKVCELNNAKSKGFVKKITGKKVAGSQEDLLDELSNKFISIRKKYTSPSTPHWLAEFSIGKEEKPLKSTFGSFTSNLLDYTNDVSENARVFAEKNKDKSVVDFVKNHKSRRIGSRVMSNLGIWLAVVGFSLAIPKIYSMGLNGKNPGMAGLDDAEDVVDLKKDDNTTKTSTKDNKQADSVENKSKDVNFKGREGLFKGVAESLGKNKSFKKASDFFEFDGVSMTNNSTLALLYGIYLPTRLFGASDKHDVKETMTRDLLSFTAILFASKAISRVFSKILSGVSGLALNSTPESHEKSAWNKFKNYVGAGDGIHVFKSDEIVARYSNVHEYKNGINGFFDFVTENGGNLKRVLSVDKDVKAHAEKILKKDLNGATNKEIAEEFAKARKTGSKELNSIYEILKNPDNKLVKRAKVLNSTFGFASTIVLVPMFMIWLAKYCEKMTKQDVNDEKFTEVAKRYMHDDFASADYQTVKALDKKVLNDVKEGKIYGYKYDKKNNIIRSLTGKEKQVSDIRVEIKKYVDKATPKGTKRVIIKPEQKQNNSDYNMFVVSQNQLKNNFLTK